MKKVRVLLGCVVLLISVVASRQAGASATGNPPQSKRDAGAERKSSLVELKSVNQLKDTFQRDSGKVRLVALVSPT